MDELFWSTLANLSEVTPSLYVTLNSTAALPTTSTSLTKPLIY